MQRAVVKYSIIIIFALIYINRALFISAAYEVESQGKEETNSIIELFLELATGKNNDIDEDGDQQSNCNCVKIVQHDFSQQMSKNFELINLYSKNAGKLIFPNKENSPTKDFNDEIEHPPECYC